MKGGKSSRMHAIYFIICLNTLHIRTQFRSGTIFFVQLISCWKISYNFNAFGYQMCLYVCWYADSHVCCMQTTHSFYTPKNNKLHFYLNVQFKWKRKKNKKKTECGALMAVNNFSNYWEKCILTALSMQFFHGFGRMISTF